MGGSRIVSFFGSTVLDAESSLLNYRATESFLRFLTKVFKQPYPQGCLPADDLLHLEQSILVQALESTYMRCMTDYFNTGYADAASMGKYTSRLLKLTNTLLNFFLEIPQSQKAPMCESIPRFDLLLEFIT